MTDAIDAVLAFEERVAKHPSSVQAWVDYQAWRNDAAVAAARVYQERLDVDTAADERKVLRATWAAAWRTSVRALHAIPLLPTVIVQGAVTSLCLPLLLAPSVPAPPSPFPFAPSLIWLAHTAVQHKPLTKHEQVWSMISHGLTEVRASLHRRANVHEAVPGDAARSASAALPLIDCLTRWVAVQQSLAKRALTGLRPLEYRGAEVPASHDERKRKRSEASADDEVGAADEATAASVPARPPSSFVGDLSATPDELIAAATTAVAQGELDTARAVLATGLHAPRHTKTSAIVSLHDAALTLEEGVLAQLVSGDDNVVTLADLVAVAEEAVAAPLTAPVALQVSRVARLIARHSLLLNAAALRQAPTNISLWLQRARLVMSAGGRSRQRDILASAIDQLSTASDVQGHRADLWLALARSHSDDGNLSEGLAVLRRALPALAPPVPAAERVTIHRAIVEQVIVLDGLAAARDAAETAVAAEPHAIPLWQLLADLEESLADTETGGSFDAVRAAYQGALDRGAITVASILRYAHLLTQRSLFEDAFVALEDGIALFEWPAVSLLWAFYLRTFVATYKGTKVSRARALFDRLLESQPPARYTAPFYLAYALFEEEFGSTSRAMDVYRRARGAVPPETVLPVVLAAVSCARHFEGPTGVRAVFMDAMNELKGPPALQLATYFADTEVELGEVPRARAILTHAAQHLASPVADEPFWIRFEDFEGKYGTSETFQEIIRIRRARVAAGVRE